MNNKYLHMVAFVLVIAGGLNWGLWGLFDFNLVDNVFGMGSFVSKLIYDAVGLAAIWLVVTHMHDCRVCGTADGKKKK